MLQTDATLAALTRSSESARSAAAAGEELDLGVLHELSGPLEKALLQTPAFAAVPGYLIRSDNGTRGIQALDAAMALIRRAARDGDPRGALDWLEGILRADSARGHGVMALWGVATDRTAPLTDRVTILPFAQLPDSRTKGWLSHAPLLPRAAFTSWVFFRSPASALMTPEVIHPLIRPMNAPPQPQREEPDPLRLLTLLQEARLSLTLVGPSTPLNAGYWFQYDDPDLHDLAHAGVFGSNLEVLPSGFSEDQNLDLDEARAIVTSYLSLSAPTRDTRASSARIPRATIPW